MKKKKKKKEIKLLIEKVEENHNPVELTSQDPFGLLAKGIIDWFRSLIDKKNEENKEK